MASSSPLPSHFAFFGVVGIYNTCFLNIMFLNKKVLTNTMSPLLCSPFFTTSHLPKIVTSLKSI
ncbi:hypothetical protein D6C95_08769 [Aureobasidium pullulans]|nr:hypothetical protein D6C95_08769 [Aureobasidium pullulans]